MSDFKPMMNQAGGSSNFRNENKVVREDSGYTFIPYYLKNDEASTVFRMFPSFDEKGNEEITLDPKGSHEALCASLARCFIRTEVATIFRNGRITFISSIKDEDRDGNTVNNFKSPVMTFTKRLGYKVWEQVEKMKKGYDTDIPAHWLEWNEKGTLSNPQTVFLIQGMASEINGVPCTNIKQETEWVVPAIFGLPKSAEKTFMKKITTRKDEKKDLDLNNNRFGDFCSCEGGSLLRLCRYSTEEGKRTSVTYSLEQDDLCPVQASEVIKVIKPWDEILYIPTVEDVMEILCDIFEKSAIDYAFRKSTYRDYIPEHIKGASDGIAEADNLSVVKGLLPASKSKPVVKAPVKTPVKVEVVPEPAASEGTEGEDGLNMGTPLEEGPGVEERLAFQANLAKLSAKVAE